MNKEDGLNNFIPNLDDLKLITEIACDSYLGMGNKEKNKPTGLMIGAMIDKISHCDTVQMFGLNVAYKVCLSAFSDQNFAKAISEHKEELNLITAYLHSQISSEEEALILQSESMQLSMMEVDFKWMDEKSTQDLLNILMRILEIVFLNDEIQVTKERIALTLPVILYFSAKEASEPKISMEANEKHEKYSFILKHTLNQCLGFVPCDENDLKKGLVSIVVGLNKKYKTIALG